MGPGNSPLGIEEWTLAGGDEVDEGLVRGLLDRLVATSLLLKEDGNKDGYRMLEPVRQFAAEQAVLAGEADGLSYRHAAYFLALAEQALPHLKVNPEVAWLDRLDGTVSNIRAAMAWMADHDAVEAGMRLAGALWRFWYVRSHIDYEREWLTSMLAMELGSPDLIMVAGAYEAAAVLAFAQSDPREAAALYRSCCDGLEAAGEVGRLAEVLDRLALAESAIGEHESALAHGQQALSIKDESATKLGQAISVGIIADVYFHMERLTEAYDHYQRSLQLYDEVGDQEYARLRPLRGLARVEQIRGNMERAREILEEGYYTATRYKSKMDSATWLRELGTLAYKLAQFEDARRFYLQALRLDLQIGSRDGLALLANNLGQVAWLTGHHEDAKDLFAQALRYLASQPMILERMVPLINLAATHAAAGDHEASEHFAQETIELANTLKLRVLNYAQMSIVPSRPHWPDGTVSAWREELSVSTPLRREELARRPSATKLR